MKIYTAIWEDRHSDTTAHLFSDLDEAISWAREKADEYSKRYPEDYMEEDYEGYLFYVSYSCEGDHIHITEEELDKEVRDESI